MLRPAPENFRFKQNILIFFHFSIYTIYRVILLSFQVCHNHPVLWHPEKLTPPVCFQALVLWLVWSKISCTNIFKFFNAANFNPQKQKHPFGVSGSVAGFYNCHGVIVTDLEGREYKSLFLETAKNIFWMKISAHENRFTWSFFLEVPIGKSSKKRIF